MRKNNKFCCDKTYPVNQLLSLFLLLVFTLFISACSETTEVTEEGASQKATSGTTLYLKLVNNDLLVRNLDQSTTTTVVATLKTADNEAIVGEVIEFSTDLGTLAAENGLTDSAGRARVDLASGSIPSAGKVTATVIYAGETLTVSYGFAVGGTLDTSTGAADNTGGNNTSPDPDPNVSQSNDGAMEFVSALPQQITLKSAGGAGLSELSTVTFKLVGADGLPLANQDVTFKINNVLGGVSVEPVTGTTGFDGLVSTVVQSGTVPTSVRVTATAIITDGTVSNEIFSQSDKLAIGMGTPDQNSMSISLSNRAPEAWEFDGEEVDVTVFLGDHFNNFIPDGTTVYFTTEGGVIEPSCETVDSACTVKWVSANPRPADHRVTILATTLGSESFQDTDGDGVYSQADGEGFIDANGNGIYDEPFIDENGNGIFDETFVRMPNGLHDVGEAYTDALNGVYDFGESFTDALNGIYDLGEVFTDLNNNNVYDDGETFVDALNGVWNDGEVFVDELNGRYDLGESFVDVSIYTINTVFIDRNGNGVFDGDRLSPAGEILFTDSNNGNGLYDGSGRVAAGEAILDKNTNSLFDGPGFADLGESYLDVNENLKRDVDELYFDSNNNEQYDIAGDGLFNGVYCKVADEVCATNRTVSISDSAVLIMAGSDAKFVVDASTTKAPFDFTYVSNMRNIFVNAPTTYIDASNSTATITVYYADSAGEVLPGGTTVTVTSNKGELVGAPSGKLPNNRVTPFGGLGRLPDASEISISTRRSFSFSINDTDETKIENGVISIKFETPAGRTTTARLDIII